MLTKKYIQDHKQFLEKVAPELGKKIGELILDSAQKEIEENGEKEKIELTATVTLEPTAAGCVSATICLPFVGCSTVHIGV